MDEKVALDMQHSRIYSTLNNEKLVWEGASKKVQECLVSYYVMDMKNVMGLTSGQTEQLRQIIKTGLHNKIFNKTNIRMENNRIFSINGLLWYDQNKSFYINPELKPTITRSYTKKEIGCSYG